MSDLIEKLKAATEGLRELDAEIIKSLPYRCDPTAEYSEEEDCLVWYEVHSECEGWPSELIGQELPHYSTSLDAALTLVPYGCKFDGVNLDKNQVGYDAFILDPEHTIEAHGWTPALAICAAALEAMEKENE